MNRRDEQLPGRRVPIWPWLQAIDKVTGRSRRDQDTRKRKVKRADTRRWRRDIERGDE